jgi:phage terminase large subunit-like protein
MVKISTYDKKQKVEAERLEYAEDCIYRAIRYEDDVLSGKVLAGQLIHKAIHRRRDHIDKKYNFSRDALLDIFKFLWTVNIPVKSKPARFVPLDWQCWVIYNTYGYFLDKEFTRRLVRYSNIWVARKNGKTGLASILALAGLVKGEMEAEVYFCATTKDQASQALRYMKSMVRISPYLNKKIRRYKYSVQYNLNGECTAKPVANEPDKLDGLSPSFAIIDEKHAFPDNDMFNIMKTGTLARENPLIVTISTSGFHKDYPYYNETEVGKKILNGDVEDDSTFYAYYTLDDDSEAADPSMWVKANPSIIDCNGNGIISLSALEIDYKKACLVKVDKMNFLTKNLNIFSDSVDAWIPDDVYKRCFKELPVEDLFGSECYLGFDLSKTRDFSSLVALVKHKDTGELHVLPEFYFPTEENEENKIRPAGIDLTAWIEKGYIIPHERRIINEDSVFERIKWFCDNFDVKMIGYDPFNAVRLVERIKSDIIVDTMMCRQNASFFNFPCKLVEMLIFEEGIWMSKNPVMRWNFMNVVMYFDGNNNMKPMKNKSLDSIDGVVALLNAVGAYAENNFDAVSDLMNEISQSIMNKNS